MNQVAPVPNWKWQLPTEDMWEYAARCRGGKTPTRYPWGDNFDSKRCNCVEQRLNGTAEVGTFYSGNTSDGCADMAGNVWEFVALSQEREVARLRGGSFVNNAEEIRSDLRLWGVPLPYGAHDFGFRCALVQATT
jgi:formylglycine-generating enzyme required for sulfatase activity